jgi:hypothetical protein
MLSEKIQNILISNDLQDYIPIFEMHKLDRIELINELTDEDFEKVGITILGDRKKIIKLFSSYQNEIEKHKENLSVPVNVIVQESQSGGSSGAGWGVVGGILGGLLGVGLVIFLLLNAISNETISL